MESEHTAKTLQIALGSYDRKELRVEKNYLQEQSPALECTCFQNGGRLLEQLRQGRQFDVVILCSQLEDMSGLEFLMNIRSMDPKPNVVLFDEGRRQNTSAICLESGDGFCYVGHAELKNLLWELYRLPGLLVGTHMRKVLVQIFAIASDQAQCMEACLFHILLRDRLRGQCTRLVLPHLLHTLAPPVFYAQSSF